MKDFAFKHPWITALLIIPTIVSGVASVAISVAVGSKLKGGDKDKGKEGDKAPGGT